MSQGSKRGWIVTFAGVGINLMLGVLYAYSVVKSAIEANVAAGGEFSWSVSQLNDPYAWAVWVFALVMVPAGLMLDKLGPRLTSTIGGFLVGAGFIVASTSSSLGVWILGFGILAGAGIGMAYASATPAAVKWFPASMTGLIAGLVVSGFGLASAYIAPLSTWMIGSMGIGRTMFWLGVGFLLVVVLLSQLLRNPPAEYVPPETAKVAAARASRPSADPVKVDYTWREMMSTPTFWLLWIIYFIGAGAGLMVISSASGMAKTAFAETAWIAVTVLAVGNAAGRIVAGILSDRIGRTTTLRIMLVFQAILMFSFLALSESDGLLILLLATFIGFNYGSNLTLFPAATKDCFGLKSFGLNYGIMFTAWGFGGGILSRISQMLKADTGSLDSSFVMAGALLLVGAALTFLVKRPVALPATGSGKSPVTVPVGS